MVVKIEVTFAGKMVGVRLHENLVIRTHVRVERGGAATERSKVPSRGSGDKCRETGKRSRKNQAKNKRVRAKGRKSKEKPSRNRNRSCRPSEVIPAGVIKRSFRQVINVQYGCHSIVGRARQDAHDKGERQSINVENGSALIIALGRWIREKGKLKQGTLEKEKKPQWAKG